MRKRHKKQQPHRPQQVQDRVLRFLSYRPRSIKEVEDYLQYRLKVESQKTRESLIQKLIRLNFLDDKAFVHWWVERRHGKNPRGARMIQQELRKKGIAQEGIDEMFDQESNDDEVDRARRALEKKRSTYATLTRDEFHRKAGTYLMRRGFDWETIRSALEIDRDEKKR